MNPPEKTELIVLSTALRCRKSWYLRKKAHECREKAVKYQQEANKLNLFTSDLNLEELTFYDSHMVYMPSESLDKDEALTCARYIAWFMKLPVIMSQKGTYRAERVDPPSESPFPSSESQT